MKNKTRDYAKALVEIMGDKKYSEKNITEGFFKLLIKNKDIKKAKEIINVTESLFLKKTGNKKIIIEIARKIDVKNMIKDIAKKGDIIQEKINPDVIAGVKLIVNNEEQLDFSLSKKLNDIFI